MRGTLRPVLLGNVNIVVVVSGGLSETLQAAPTIAALARGAGERVLVACPPSAAPLTERLAGAGQLLPVRCLAGRPSLPSLTRLWRELRGRRLDVAVVCSDSQALRAAVYLAAIPRRIGCAGGAGARLLSDRVPCPPNATRAQRWLGLCGRLGFGDEYAPNSVLPGDEATARAEQLLLGTGIGDGRPLVVMTPGNGFADQPVEGWPLERYAHLANRLASRHGAGIVLVGPEGDRAAADAMRLDLAAASLDLCGQVDLPTAAAVIARCDLLVGPDTPLLHLAAAVGTVSVGLFGPTDGRAAAPAGPGHRVVQALPNGAGHARLDRIRVDDVLAGIESSL